MSAAFWHNPDRTKTCVMCQETFRLSGFYSYTYINKLGNPGLRYESRCKECCRVRRKAAYHANPARDRRTSAKWKADNREYLSAYNKELRQDPEYRRRHAYHQRLRKARMRASSGDNEAIRAIYAEAMRLEAIIQQCPVFDLPELGKKLHVDHIIPLAKGGAHSAENLQIIPAGINMRKGVSCRL